MLNHLPFTALRTLESVVRLRGFGRAAEELNVTQSAVSQHVKLLEEWIGHRLLIRGPRETKATENGLAVAAAVAQGFGTVEQICGKLRTKQSRNNRGLKVAAPPGFGFVWLLPRLMAFDQKYPGIPVSLATDTFGRNFDVDENDITIRYGSDAVSGVYCERLLTETVMPVCTPKLADTLKSVHDLKNFTILQDEIHDTNNPPDWDFWAKEAGLKLPHFARTRKFGQSNMVVQAAIEGLGVTMGRSTLVNDAINDGRLVCPFGPAVASAMSYWFVCRHDALKDKAVGSFYDWLHQEVAGQ